MSAESGELFNHLKASKLSVIVPVYNEADNITQNLGLLISEVEPHFSSYEILVIDDGSSDGTRQVLERYRHPKVHSIIFKKNMGKGYAVREGFRIAKGDYILFIDGGMELHPREIRIFLGLMELYNADVVVGSKRHPQSKVDYPAIRRILSYLYQKQIKALFGLDVTDTQVGLKLFRREVVEAVLPHLSIDRYGFDLEILALAKRRGFDKFLEAPIRLDYFSKNVRSPVLELAHIAKVGLTILKDTLQLYRRLQSLDRKAELQNDQRLPSKTDTTK